MAAEDIVIGVNVTGEDKLYRLSTALNQVNASLLKTASPIRAVTNASRGLSMAIGATGRSINDHAKTVTQMMRNQAALGNESRKVKRDIESLKNSVSDLNNAQIRAIGSLQKYSKALNSIKARALVSDLKSIAQEQKRLGKDAQFVGRSLIIGLTTPLIGIGRYGLQALVAVDREVVRLNKVLESVAPNADIAAKKLGDMATPERVDKMVNSFNELDASLTSTSQKFGVAKSMVTSIAADFAELGVTNVKNIGKLTDLTAAVEKLGSMDISASQDLVQSLYFQANRSFMLTGREFANAIDREKAAISSAEAQLAMFNVIENTTALTLRDLGDAFPEVAAAATSFGLSMTEAAALLAPMKAAGFDIGASANSIKVSLQRVTAPTKQNADMFKQLSKEYGYNFNLIKGTGLDAIQGLVDGFNAIKSSAAGQEGVMEFMAKVFGVRQGPRMEVAIAQMASFDKLLKDSAASGQLAEKQIQQIANTTIKQMNASTGSTVPLINGFRDIGVLARIATAQVGQTVEGFGKVQQRDIDAAFQAREAIGKQIVQANKKGRDLIAEISSESGRAMVVELAGASSAQEIATRELENALQSLDVQLGIIKNNFKAFATELLTAAKPAIEKITKFTTKLIEDFKKLDPETRKNIANFTMITAGLVAAVGPLVFVFGQARLAFGVLGKAALSILPSIKNLTLAQLAQVDAFTRLRNPIHMVNGVITNTNGKFATFIATLASGNGPMAKFASGLGRITGVLKAQQTIAPDVKSALTAIQPARAVTDLEGGLAAAVKSKTKVSRGASTLDVFRRTLPGGTMGTSEELLKRGQELEKLGFSANARGSIRGPGGKFARINANDRRILQVLTQSRAQSAMERAPLGVERAFSQFGRGVKFESAYGRQGPGVKDVFSFKGREITQQRAQAIAGGGLGGMKARFAESGLRAKEAMSARATAIGGGVKSLATAPVNAFKKAIDGAKGSVSALQSASTKMGIAQPGIFKKAITAVKGFAGSFGMVTKAMNLMKLAWVATGIGAAILAVAAIVYIVVKNFDQFKTVAKPGIDAIKDAIKILKDALFALIKPFINLFATISGGGEDSKNSVTPIAQAFNVLGESVKITAKVIKFVFDLIGKAIQFALGSVLAGFRGIIDIVKGIVNIFKGNFKQGITQALGGLAKAAYGLLGVFRPVFDFILKGIGLVLKALSHLPFVGDKFAKAAKALEGFGKMLKNSASIKNAVGNGIDDGAKDGANKSVSTIRSAANTMQETIASSVDEGLSEGAEKGGKSFKKSFQDVKREIKAAALDVMAGYVQEAISKIKDAMLAQKEVQQKAFDDQLETIDKLQRADESLTKTKEYEANKRALIEERELNRQNYVRNRALAIYEGRIDDARMLGLEEKKSIQDSTRQKQQLEESRRRDLAQENLEFLRKTIQDAKAEAGKYFDEAIKKFEESSKKISQLPPATVAKFNEQIDEINKSANLILTDPTNGLNAQLTTLFSNMETNIATNMPNQVVGLFANNFDEVLTTAREKYGLDTGAGIVGATVGLIADISSRFGGDTTVNTAMGTLLTTVSTTVDTWAETMKTLTFPDLMGGITSVIDSYTNGEGIWATSLAEGLKIITNKYAIAFEGMKTAGINAVQGGLGELRKLYQEYYKLKSQIEGTGGAGGTGGGGGAGAGGAGEDTGSQTQFSSSAAGFRQAEESFTAKTKESVGVNNYGALVNDPGFSAKISVLKDVISGKGYHQLKDNMYSLSYSLPTGQIVDAKMSPKSLIENAWLWAKTMLGDPVSRFKDRIGGSVKYDAYIKKMKINPTLSRQYGGYVNSAMSQSVPALLHGGEFVINSNAVNKIGIGALESINNMRFKNPAMSQPKVVSENYSTQNVNIYVDNFIGQEQWFESMMKEYNIKVVPRNQKAAGLENRVIRSYNGINRGM